MEVLGPVPIAQFLMDESREQPSLEKVLLLLLWCWTRLLMPPVRRSTRNGIIWRQGMSDASSNGIYQIWSAIVVFQPNVRLNWALFGEKDFGDGKMVCW